MGENGAYMLAQPALQIALENFAMDDAHIPSKNWYESISKDHIRGASATIWDTTHTLNGWEHGAKHQGGDLAVTDDQPHFGDRSLYVKHSFGPTKNLKPLPGKAYIFSAWVRPITANTIKFTVELHIDGLGTVDDFFAGHFSGYELNKWHYFEHIITLENLAAVDGNDDHLRIWIGNGSTDAPTEFYVDDIRFYPQDAYVTTTYYDHLWRKPLVTVDENNNPGNKVIYDIFGRIKDITQMVHNGPDILLTRKEYHMMTGD